MSYCRISNPAMRLDMVRKYFQTCKSRIHTPNISMMKNNVRNLPGEKRIRYRCWNLSAGIEEDIYCTDLLLCISNIRCCKKHRQLR